MSARYDIEAFKKRIDGVKIEENPALVRQKSRDFFWYSPTLKRQLDAVTADIVVSPVSEQQVIQVLAAAHDHAIPVTPARHRHRQLRAGHAAFRRDPSGSVAIQRRA